jgi:hypothetical protein
MGLLGKAIARNNARTGSIVSKGGAASQGDVTSESVVSAATHAILSFINDFHYKNPQFHSIVFQGSKTSTSEDIYDMVACHGATAADLPGGNILVLLPGALDRELFAHRLSHSTGSTVLIQFRVNSPSLALETLGPYLR